MTRKARPAASKASEGGSGAATAEPITGKAELIKTGASAVPVVTGLLLLSPLYVATQ